jgi:hypothetical protein
MRASSTETSSAISHQMPMPTGAAPVRLSKIDFSIKPIAISPSDRMNCATPNRMKGRGR